MLTASTETASVETVSVGTASVETSPRLVAAPPKQKRRTDRLDDETPYPIAHASVTSAYPAIHGARVTGATPGRPFLFRVPATGDLPLTYSAGNLPVGLSLDVKSGLITGSLQGAGTTIVKLEVRNARGVARRDLVVRAGDDLLAQTPPMGWNSWNAYKCTVDEKKVRDAADQILQTGLASHGYQYVNIDDCWQGERDERGNLGVNPKFGSLKALGDYLHSNGLKFGIYSSPGPQTCAHHAGSFGYEAQDARAYASWGVDYLKYDWCTYGLVAVGTGVERAKRPYRMMAQALNKVPRDIVYSLCQHGYDDIWEWGDDPDIRGNLWRTTGDIHASFNSMRDIGFQQVRHAKYAGPGHWNDPDMLFLHVLRPNEQLMHLTLWSMNAAPLLIGSDVSQLSTFALDALSNDEVIAVDQDPLGIPAHEVKSGRTSRIWARPLWDGTQAVALFNRDQKKMTLTPRWVDLGLHGPQAVRDLWAQRDLGTHKSDITLTVPAHGALLLKVGKPNAQDYAPQHEE